MLGVFKKRWKPKRNASNVNIATKESLLDPPVTVDNCTISSNLPKSIHTSPIEDSKFIAERSSISSGTETIYPRTPNICVADGRIEFIRSPRESATYISSYGTDEENGNVEEEEGKREICDDYNETAVLEARIRELEDSLEQERKLVQKEKLISAKLQRQLSRKDLIQRDVDRERRLRLDAESKLRLSMSETEKCKTKLSAIQAQFTRMEDTVRTMVQYKSKYEHIKLDKAAVTRGYESQLLKLQDAVSSLHSENQTLKRQVRNLEVTGFEQVQSALLQRLESLEIENINLRQESDNQRRKYEKCLDDVAHQVVRAILSQKGLKEEVGSLRRKLRDAECANLALTNLLVPENRTVLHLSGLSRKMWSCELPAPPSPCGSSLVDSGTVKALPHQDVEDEEISGGSSVLRDEGYSTMSSDVQGAQETPRRGLEGLAEIQESQGGDTPLGSDSTSVMSTSSSRDRRYLKNLDSDIYLSVSLLLDARHHLHNPRHSFPPSLSSAFPSLSHYSPSLSHSHHYAPSRFPLQSLSHSGPILPYQSIVRSLSDSHLCLNLPTALHTSVLLSDRWNSSLATDEDIESWTSGDWWDGDCVEHWLRLDEMRGGCMSQYDTSELEDWTMREEDRSLSPCRSDRLLISPSTCDSWSSSSDNASESLLANSTTLGVDFTRDFYRLVKFESTKSLSSTTSASGISTKDGLDPSCLATKGIADDSTSRKRSSSLVPVPPTSAQTKVLRLEDLTSGDYAPLSQETDNCNHCPRRSCHSNNSLCAGVKPLEPLPQESVVTPCEALSIGDELIQHSNQSSEEIECDKDSRTLVNIPIGVEFQCDRTADGEAMRPITRIATESTSQRSKCRQRIISGGACQKTPEDRPPPKPTRERITSGGSCEGNVCDIRQFSPSASEFSRVEFSPEDNLHTNLINPLNQPYLTPISNQLNSVNNLSGEFPISGGFPNENLFRNLYENISLVPQYESNNVDQLYGTVRWSEDYASDNEDKFWLEMDKERDRFWSEIDKDRHRFWNGSDKERDREEEGEIECLQEDFSYELSSRGVSRNGLRSELNTVIEENEEEDTVSVSLSPPSLPPSPLNQSNSTISHHQGVIECNGGLPSDPAMTRSMASSISTPDTVVNIHDTRPNDSPLLKPNELPTSESIAQTNEVIPTTSELIVRTNEPIGHTNGPIVLTSELTVQSSEPIDPINERIFRNNELIVQNNELKNSPNNPKELNRNDNGLSGEENRPNNQRNKLNRVQNELLVNRYEVLLDKSSDSWLNEPYRSDIEICDTEKELKESSELEELEENGSNIYENATVVKPNNFANATLVKNPTIVKPNSFSVDVPLADFIDSRTTSKEVIEQLNRLIESNGMDQSSDSVSDFLGSCSRDSDCSSSLYSNIPAGSYSCNCQLGSCKGSCASSRKRSSSSKIPVRNNSSCKPMSNSAGSFRKYGSCNKENGSCSQVKCSCKYNASCKNFGVENGSSKNGCLQNSLRSRATLYNGCQGSRNSTGSASGSVGSRFQYSGSDGRLCSNTGWIHVEKHIDLADPKARANLLDVMLASSRSSSSSSEEEGEDQDPLGYYHLHALHRFRRQKKAATREPLGALRFSTSSRTSILGRDDFYVRYGAPEQEAMASFDFLDTLSTGSSLPSGDEEKVTEL